MVPVVNTPWLPGVVVTVPVVMSGWLDVPSPQLIVAE